MHLHLVQAMEIFSTQTEVVQYSLTRFSESYFKNNYIICPIIWKSFPAGSVVKNLPARREIQVWSLGQEDLL